MTERLLTCQVASRDYRCDVCGRKIPAGHRYWRDFDVESLCTHREHNNCPEYEHEEVIDAPTKEGKK